MAEVFAEDAALTMVVKSGSISFPPATRGREAITDVLVRRFSQSYENVYSTCLGDPPRDDVNAFACDWLVAMTEREDGTVRTGCGRYDWRVDPSTGLTAELTITIETMLAL